MEKSKLQEALEELLASGAFNFSIHRYSGRGMFGRECLSIVGDIYGSDLVRLGFALAQTTALTSGELPRAQTDQMGRGIVVYWPGVEIAGADICQAVE